MRHIILVFGISCLLAVSGGIGMAVHEMRALAEREHQARLDQSLTASSRHLAITLDSIAFLFSTAARDLAPESWQEIASSERHWHRLREQTGMLPHLRSLWLVDESAEMRLFSDKFPSPELNVADRGYYRRLADGLDGGFIIDEPRIGKFTGRPYVSVSFPIYTVSGDFRGIIAGAVEPSHFEPFMASVSPCHGCRVEIGRMTDNGRFPLIQIGPDPGENNLSGSLRIRDELYVSVAVPKAEVDRAWTREARTMLLVGAVLVIALVVMLSYAWAMLRRDEEMRAALVASSRRAEAASEAKSRFLTMMSHEIRTPLHAVLGILDMLRRPGRNPEIDDKQQLALAARSGDMLLSLLTQILDFSKLDSDQPTLREAEIDAEELLAVLVAAFELRARSNGVTIVTETDLPDSENWLGDGDKIKQILFNLVANAVKYSPGGKVTLSATLSPTESDAATAAVLFKVVDDGPGLTDEDRQFAFEEFYQGSAGRGKSGGGLGLAISRKLANLIGARLDAENRLEGGACFTLCVPLKRIKRANTERPVNRPIPRIENGDEADGPPKRRLLVAEDMAVNRMLLSAMLNPIGYEIIEAEDGAQAIDAVRNHGPFTAILMDIQMPKMDGITATQKIRALPAPVGSTPIIAVTANAFEDEIRTYMSAGMNDCIAKPVHREELLNALEKVAL